MPSESKDGPFEARIRKYLTATDPLTDQDPAGSHELVRTFQDLIIILIKPDYLTPSICPSLNKSSFDPSEWEAAGFDERVVRIAGNLPCVKWPTRVAFNYQAVDFRQSGAAEECRVIPLMRDDYIVPKTALKLFDAHLDGAYYFYDVDLGKSLDLTQ
jgi:hypothetical protein